MALKYSLSNTILDQITADAPKMEKLGMATYTDLQKWYEGLDVLDQLDVMTRSINNLEGLDPLFTMITQKGTDGTKLERWSRASFKKGAIDTMGKGYKPVLQKFTVPFDTYDCAIEVDQMMIWEDQKAVIDQILSDVYDAYKRILRAIALEALLVLNTDPNKILPGFWRDTSGFAAANQLVPHPNGFKVFDASESHYMAKSAIDEDVVDDLSKKVRSKGYGRSGLVVVSNENTWKLYEKEFTYDEIRRNDLVSVSSDFAPELGSTTLVTLPESDFPDGYMLCYDPTAKFLYHKEAENERFRGLFRAFETLSEIRTSKRAEFKLIDTGMGVIEKGAGAVMYIGGATYSNPDLSPLFS